MAIASLSMFTYITMLMSTYLSFVPQLYAAFSNAAGPAEKPGAGTLSQQYATSVSDKFDRIKNLPVLQFAGLYDNTVGQSSPKEQQAAFDKVGNKNAKTIWLQADHNKMSTMPFEDMRMLNFFKSCRRNGGGAASNDYAPVAEEKKGDDKKNEQGQEQKKGDADNKKSDEEQKKENKDEDKKVSSEKNLSPATSSGDSSSHKQFNAELDSPASQPQTEESKEREAVASIGETQAQTPAKTEAKAPSSGHCKKRSAKKNQRMMRRSIGEEGYAHPGPIRRGIYTLTSEEEIIQRSSRPALESLPHSLAQEKKKTKRGLSLNDIIQNVDSLKKMEVNRNALESLKAHAGSRRSLSHDSSSHKLRRR